MSSELDKEDLQSGVSFIRDVIQRHIQVTPEYVVLCATNSLPKGPNLQCQVSLFQFRFAQFSFFIFFISFVLPFQFPHEIKLQRPLIKQQFLDKKLDGIIFQVSSIRYEERDFFLKLIESTEHLV